MKDANTQSDVSSEVTKKLRVKPSLGIGIAIYFLYLAIFFTVWAVNGVNYPEIGKTLESTILHYAMPTLLASAAVAIVITMLGWWKIVLFDKEKSGPKWAWIGIVAMLMIALIGFARVNTDNLTFMLICWSMLGAVGVGFGEEMINRGTLLVGLRTRFTEGKVWFFSTLAFAALHLPNMFFGAPISSTLIQFVFAFIIGSLLYSIRRVTGTLIVAMLLHGLWDSALFLAAATGVEPFPGAGVIYPLAIIVAVAVVLKNKGKTVQTYA